MASSIADYHFKQDFNYYLNAANKLSFGFESTFHITQPGDASSSASSSYNNVYLQKKHSLESALYISNEWNASNKVKDHLWGTVE